MSSGSCGRSTTLIRSSRPAEVTTPISPRAVAGTAETITSCLIRLAPAPDGRGSPFAVRASRPVEDSSTRHGSSATWSGTAAGVAADSSSTVRRSVPNFLATAASSAETSLRSSASESRIRVSSSISAFSRSFSASSSMRSYLVSRRSGVSRMYWVCTSLSENRSIRRCLACAEFSLERISRMTSSMSTSAVSRPSTRCRRSRRLPRRNSLRRRTTVKRWSR
ncbi:hypothetical protein SFUMM280S_05507 [Streptomyces fumanus]